MGVGGQRPRIDWWRVFGVWAALTVPDIGFRRILSIVMLAATLGTLLQRLWGRGSSVASTRSPWHWTMVLGFFVVGLYGG